MISPRWLAVMGGFFLSATQAPGALPVTLRAKPFALSEVRLLDGAFKAAQDRDVEYLLKLEPDRFLAGMREAAGLPAKGARYGGWDKSGSGLVGHYLSACAQMAAATGDPRLRQRVDYLVAQMAECQQARPEGGLYANGWEANKWFPALGQGKAEFMDVLPWYVMHKTLAGLRDAWTEGGNTQARDTLVRLCDFCAQVTAKLTDAQWRTMTSKEHGAPNEIFADVFALTGDQKYLDLARKFAKQDIVQALDRGDGSVLANKHANTQIPLFVGYEQIYEAGGEANWHAASARFWDEVTTRQTFAFGGNSVWEKFINPAEFEGKLLEPCGPETCNTYNLLKLTEQLYGLDPQGRYTDYAERALYNQILPSENVGPEGGFAYYTPTRPGHYKVYSRPFDAMWCCVGTGMENQARYGGFIYAAAPQRLFVNLCVASELRWKEEGVSVRQATAFPDRDDGELAFTVAQPHRFTVSVRCPSWTAPGAMRLELNGQPFPAAARPGGYADVTRVWQTGDRLRMVWPQRVTAEVTPGAGKFAAFFYGPILLAAPLGRAGLEDKDFFAGGDVAFEQLGRKGMDQASVPAVGGGRLFLTSLVQRELGAGGLRFQLATANGPGSKAAMVPFYAVGLQRYSVYFPFREAR